MEQAKEKRLQELHERGLLKKKELFTEDNDEIRVLINKRTEIAQTRLRNFVLCTDMSDDNEREKLLKFYKSHYLTFTKLLDRFAEERRSGGLQ